MRQAILWAATAAVVGSTAVLLANRPRDGCPAYIPAGGVLVAHAGGGLPDRTYANSRQALDLAARHGFRFVELDFREKGGTLLLGHDDSHPSSLTLGELMRWLDDHPSVSVITDVKTDNIAGLTFIKAAAGARLERFIPQIYLPEQLKPARGLGYRRIIFAQRIGESEGWFPWVNRADLFAVTLPANRAGLAARIAHPVFLYTVDRPTRAFGLYTNCLVPKA